VLGPAAGQPNLRWDGPQGTRSAIAILISNTARPLWQHRHRPDLARDNPADVLVVFGITGDLARVMTFSTSVKCAT
jgi:hypothetical protein